DARAGAALGQLGENAVPSLIGSLADAVVSVRARAAAELRRWPCPEAAAALLRALADPDAAIRAASVRTLGAAPVGGPVLSALRGALEGSGGVRETGRRRRAARHRGSARRLAAVAPRSAWASSTRMAHDRGVRPHRDPRGLRRRQPPRDSLARKS